MLVLRHAMLAIANHSTDLTNFRIPTGYGAILAAERKSGSGPWHRRDTSSLHSHVEDSKLMVSVEATAKVSRSGLISHVSWLNCTNSSTVLMACLLLTGYMSSTMPEGKKESAS